METYGLYVSIVSMVFTQCLVCREYHFLISFSGQFTVGTTVNLKLCLR